MSELKAGVIATPHNEGMSFHRGSDVIAVTELETEFYLKSEADTAIAKLNSENERLKKCEIWMKQHFYCEEVIACESAKNRRLKRALWLARAERAKESHFMWCQLIYDKKYGIVKFNVRKEWGQNIKQGQTLHTPQGWADVWDNVERKCRAMAYKF